jgi:hypothetical protein
MGAFLFIVFEEYYKGYFKLGIFNGVSDGSFLIYVLFIFTGFSGNAIWKDYVSIFGWELRLVEIFLGS